MKRTVVVGIGMIALAGAGLSRSSLAHEPSQAASAPEGPKLETLLTAALEGVEGTEIIVSRVTLPPHTALPRHWHPGEEFAYVLEGSAIVQRDGEPDVTAGQGEVVKVPLKRVHTAVTTEEGATFLVFRVHAEGQPERVLVD